MEQTREVRREARVAPGGASTFTLASTEGQGARIADAVLAWITELPAAVLLAAEIIVLTMGVFSRYALNRPLVWSEELAEGLFLWLAMFGAAIALRRGEHMRMTAVVERLPQHIRPWLETISMMVVAVFLAELIVPAEKYVTSQFVILTPAMQVPDSFRCGALLIGFVLMFAIVVVRVVRAGTPLPRLVGSLLIVIAVQLILTALNPFFVGIGNASLAVFFVGIVAACLVIGTPIAFCFGIASLWYLATATASPVPLSIVVGRIDGGTSNFVLASIPLFIFLGYLMDMTGLARVLTDFMGTLVGHFRGGLSYVLLGAMFLVSGISGAKSADMAAVAPVLFPEMKRRQVPPGELIAQLAASGAMAETIPPSVVLIIIGSVTGVSINALFIGGMLPALVAALALVGVVFVRARSSAGTLPPRASFAAMGKAFFVAIPALVLPFLIRGAVAGGVATATEVATIGVVYTIAIALVVYRQFAWRRLYPMLVDTAALAGAILLIIATATVMAWALTQSGFAQSLVEMMSRVPGGQAGFMVISILVFIVLGSVLEGIPVIVLFGPLLFPVAAKLGINDVHYAIVVILAMGIGLFAPPLGVGFYSACAIGKVRPDEAMTRVLPYLAALAVALLLVAAFPWLSTGLLPKAQ
jgi:tripartite ATP-independent transporter DctM subunit